jgi:hypothetical protein
VVSVQTIIVGAISGLAGGLLATWLRIRHERIEAFRDRLITAADDLATGLLQALIGLDHVHRVCLDNGFLDTHDPPRFTIRQPPTGELPDVITKALDRSRELTAEAHARQARVALLVGPVSPADRAVTLMISALKDSLSGLEKWPVPDLDRYRSERSTAAKYLHDFTLYAQREIKDERPWYERRRVAVWVRQHWRSWRSRSTPEAPARAPAS